MSEEMETWDLSLRPRGPVFLPARPPASIPAAQNSLGEGHKGPQWCGTVQLSTRLRETILDTKWLCDPVQVA